jgi:hypothetical protein
MTKKMTKAHGETLVTECKIFGDACRGGCLPLQIPARHIDTSGHKDCARSQVATLVKVTSEKVKESILERSITGTF